MSDPKLTPAEILRRARARIEDPKRWTQADYAKDATGNECASDSPAAVCWCAEGALWVEGSMGRGKVDLNGWSPALAFLEEAAEKLGHADIICLNDSTDHATVLRMFDDAIARAEAAS